MTLGHDESLEYYEERLKHIYKRARCTLDPKSLKLVLLRGIREDILENLNMCSVGLFWLAQLTLNLGQDPLSQQLECIQRHVDELQHKVLTLAVEYKLWKAYLVRYLQDVPYLSITRIVD